MGSLNESAMSDISLFSSSASSPLFSPLLSTGRSHQGPHGGFSSGFGGLVIVVTTFAGRGFPDPWVLYAQNGLHMAEEKFGDLENVTETSHENYVESDDGEGLVSWVGGIVTELVDLYRQEVEDEKETEEKLEKEEEKY